MVIPPDLDKAAELCKRMMESKKHDGSIAILQNGVIVAYVSRNTEYLDDMTVVENEVLAV